MFRTLLTILLIVGWGGWSMGQDRAAASPPDKHVTRPAEKPAAPAADRAPAPNRAGARDEARPSPASPPPMTQLAPKERMDFVHFMRENASHVLIVLRDLPPSPARRMLAGDFIDQWRELLAIKNDDDLKNLRLKRVAIQDAICGDILSLANGPGGPSGLAKTEADLRTHVGDLVQNTIDERTHRIDKLKELIKQEQEAEAREEKALKTDEQTQDVTVQTRVDAYNQRARQLSGAQASPPDDRSLQEIFFPDQPDQPTPNPAGN
jgi:hypothetical protein